MTFTLPTTGTDPKIATKSGLEDAVNEALSIAGITILENTYADLSGRVGSTDGQPALVSDSDLGTHTDPVVGGTVANSGSYAWSAASSAWERIGLIGEVAAAEAVDAKNIILARDKRLSDYGDGTFSQANVDTMSSDVGYVRISGAMTVAANVTVNDPIHFDAGAYISINDSVTVTIEAAVESPRQYIFRLTGTTGLVAFRGDGTEGEESRYCHVSWFGCFPLGDVAIDQAVFMQRCADAMGSSREGDIVFDTGTYYVQTKVTWSRANTVRGTGDRMTNIWAKGAIATTGDVFDTADQGCVFRNFQFNSDSARTSGAYLRLSHQRCEAYDIYVDKAHNGIVLAANEGKAYRTKSLTQNTASGSSTISVEGNRCVVDGVDFTNFDTSFPESIVRVNAQASSVETVMIRNVTGDGVTQGVLIEVGDGFRCEFVVIDGVAVERGSNQIKVELTGSGILNNYTFNGVVASDGVSGINIGLSGTGDATNGTITGLSGSDLTDTLLRVSNSSTGVANGLAYSGVCGMTATNGIYIAGTGSAHTNIAGGSAVLLDCTDGLEVKVDGGYITAFVTNATTGFRILDGSAKLTLQGRYTGVGGAVADSSTSGTVSISVS